MSKATLHSEKKKALVPILRFQEFEENWIKFKIKNLTNVVSGGTPSTLKKEFWGGSILWMNSGELNLKIVYDVKNRITELGLNKSSTKIIPENSILIGLAGQGKTRGTAAMNMIELCINQSIAAILPNEEKFNSRFLYLNIDSRYDELRNLSTGDGGRGGLNLQIIKSFNVTIPTLPEQKKIASFLSAVDEKIQQLSRKKELLSQYKKGVMQQLFSGKLRFKDENGNDYADWEDKKIGKIFEHRNETGYNEMELLSISINKGVYSQSQSNKIDNSNSDKSKYKRVLIGDIAYNSMRMWQGASSVSTLDGIVSPAYTILQRNENNCSEYFGYLFKMQFMIQTFQKHSQGLTSDTWNLKYPMISKIKVKRPCLKEQQKIANFLSSIDAKIESASQQLNQMQSFKKGLLQQMFV